MERNLPRFPNKSQAILPSTTARTRRAPDLRRPDGSLAGIPDRPEITHAATPARSGPSSRLPSLRADRPGDSFSQLSTINSHPVPRQPADSFSLRMTTRTPRAGLLRRMVPGPLQCCWGCRVQCLVSVPSPFTARLWCGGRDKWCPLKTTPTGRPQSPRFLVKGRRARNK